MQKVFQQTDDASRQPVCPQKARSLMACILAVLLCLFLSFAITGCSSPQESPSEDSLTPDISPETQPTFEFTSFTWVTWDESGNTATWIVYRKSDGGIGLSHITTVDNSANENDTTISLDDGVKLGEIVDAYNVDEWNGRYNKPKNQGFTITYIYSNGKTINTSGNPEQYRGYADVAAELNRYFDGIAGKYGV